MAVGQKVEETVHLLLTIAVLRQESASESAIDHLYLRTDDLDIGKEGLHPVVDRSTHDDDLGLFGTGLLDGLQSQGAQQMTVVLGKSLTECIESLQRHPPEEVGKDALLCLPVRIKTEQHQHQPGRMQKESQTKGRGAFGIADKGQQRVAVGQRSVEVESINLLHNFGLGIWSMIFFISHDKRSVATI